TAHPIVELAKDGGERVAVAVDGTPYDGVIDGRPARHGGSRGRRVHTTFDVARAGLLPKNMRLLERSLPRRQSGSVIGATEASSCPASRHTATRCPMSTFTRCEREDCTTAPERKRSVYNHAGPRNSAAMTSAEPSGEHSNVRSSGRTTASAPRCADT